MNCGQIQLKDRVFAPWTNMSTVQAACPVRMAIASYFCYDARKRKSHPKREDAVTNGTEVMKIRAMTFNEA